MNINSIPYRYKEIYVDSFRNQYFIYNPLSNIQILFADEISYFVFAQINGTNTINEISQKTRKVFSTVSTSQLLNAFKSFKRSELIYFNKPIIYEKIRNRKPESISTWFHITNQCNLNCPYCFVRKSNESMNNEIISSSINKIFLSAKKNNLKHVEITFSGGEPLLKLQGIINACDLSNKLSIRYKIRSYLSIITNGILLNDKVAQILKNNRISTAISFDGLNNFHDQTRFFSNKKGTFYLVQQAIKTAQRYKILSHVNVVISKKNIQNLPMMVEYFLTNSIRFHLQFFVDSNNTTENLKASDDMIIKYISQAINIIYKLLPPDKLINGLLHQVNFDNPRYTCGAVNNSFFTIRHDGKLANCNWDLNRTSGSISDDDIISGMKKDNYLKPVLSSSYDSICQKCRWRYICTACPLVFYNKSKLKIPPYCKVNKTIIPELIKMEAARIFKYGNFRKSV